MTAPPDHTERHPDKLEHHRLEGIARDGRQKGMLWPVCRDRLLETAIPERILVPPECF